MEIWVVIALIAASIAGSGLMFLARRNGRRSDTEFQSFAQAQGWTMQKDPEFGTINLSDPNDDWTLKVIFTGDGALDGMTQRRVEWHTPQGALDAGQAVLGMPLPEKSVAMMQGGGAMGQQILKAALKSTLHALGKTPFDLVIDEDTAGDPGGVVMATQGQAQAMDALRDNAALAQMRATAKTADVPVIIRATNGLLLRRPGAVKDPSDLSAMADLGKALRADL